ncbi:hypothetical protein N7535_003718 [Penicillium sp. DV-2018c]|nr:hypothetical protein N7461_000580 [Penicillium sp. DV-2018c]KAJ5576792.1 hypothetical protein N7535_003718 [Penicillium sp. DV-2018c]
MYDPLFQLKTIDILSSPGNLEDEILHQSQRYWIAEAIRVTHRAAVHDVFTDELVGWPQFPRIDRLSPQKTTHYSLDPILESKGTASGLDAMCETMDKVFSEQLGYDPSGNFSETLHLLYGDEATVKKILDVQKKGRGSRLPHDKYDWVLPIPGPFLLRRKYMDMIHDVFSGPEDASCTSSLNHSQRLLGLEQGRKSPFRHKEEVAMQGFDARVTGLYYQLFLPPGVTDLDQQEHAQKVNDHIRRSGRAGFLDAVERIRDYIFPLYIPMSGQRDEFAAHALFLQQMEVYKTWKLAIKLADIGMIRRVIARVCLLMGGAYEYDMPSFYMAILACTAAADKDLQRAILANGLINLRGAEDSWFEVDRVNERFNIQMKDTLSKQHISSIDDVATLFREAALTSEHSRNPREPVEHH